MKFDIMVGGVETRFPEFELYQKDNIVLIDFIGLSNEEYDFLVAETTKKANKKIGLEENNKLLLLMFVDDNIQYAVDLGDKFDLVSNKTKKGDGVGFSYTRKDGQVYEQMTVFS